MNSQLQTSLAQCPYCILPYSNKAVTLIKKEEFRRILHVFCEYCQHSMMLSVEKRDHGIVCGGLITDFDILDAKRFVGGEKISADDVLSAHQALKFDNFLKMR